MRPAACRCTGRAHPRGRSVLVRSNSWGGHRGLLSGPVYFQAVVDHFDPVHATDGFLSHLFLKVAVDFASQDHDAGIGLIIQFAAKQVWAGGQRLAQSVRIGRSQFRSWMTPLTLFYIQVPGMVREKVRARCAHLYQQAGRRP